MRVARLTILLLLAAVITAEPVVHTHRLLPRTARGGNALTTPNICGVCAIGIAQIIVDGPTVVPLRAVIEPLLAIATVAVSAGTPLRAASRAPPAV